MVGVRIPARQPVRCGSSRAREKPACGPGYGIGPAPLLHQKGRPRSEGRVAHDSRAQLARVCYRFATKGEDPLETFTAAELELARQLLEREAGERLVPAEAAYRAWEKLAPRLANIFTTSGNEALLSRALYLSERRFPELRTVREKPGLEQIQNALAGLPQHAALEAAAALMATILHLLITFIGQGLTLHVLAELWPDAALSDTPTAEEGQS